MTTEVQSEGDGVAPPEDVNLTLLRQWRDPIASVVTTLVERALHPILRQLLVKLRDIAGDGSPANLLEPSLLEPADIYTRLDVLLGHSSVSEMDVDHYLFWAIVPYKVVSGLMRCKCQHLLKLFERHHDSPLWSVIASFARRTLGSIASQLQVAVALLHVALSIIERYEWIRSQGQVISSSSKETVRVALMKLSEALGGNVGNESPSLIVFSDIAASMQLHQSEYMQLLQQAGSLLADTRDQAITIVARIKANATSADQDEAIKRSGQFQKHLDDALAMDSTDEFRTLADAYSEATVKPYSCITHRKDGLTSSHIQLMNSIFSPSVVSLLSSYQVTTQLVAKYKEKMESKTIALLSQDCLEKIRIGINIWQKHNLQLDEHIAEVVTLCEGTQVILQALCGWIQTQGRTTTSVATEVEHRLTASSAADIAGCESSSTLAEAASRKQHTSDPTTFSSSSRGVKANRIFLEQVLRGIDQMVSALDQAVNVAITVLLDVEETCKHVLEHAGGVRHSQSVMLFPLAQLAAKALQETRSLMQLLDQEVRHLQPPSSEAPTWQRLVLGADEPGKDLAVPTDVRRSLLILSSTVASLHDGVGHVFPSVVLVRESMDVYREIVEREQRLVASEVIELNGQLSQMRNESIRMEEQRSAGGQAERGGADAAVVGQSDEQHGDKRVHELQQLRDSVLRSNQTNTLVTLDVQYVAGLLRALFNEDDAVATMVYEIIGGLRELKSREVSRCFDAVACYCTVVELLCKFLFTSG